MNKRGAVSQHGSVVKQLFFSFKGQLPVLKDFWGITSRKSANKVILILLLI